MTFCVRPRNSVAEIATLTVGHLDPSCEGCAQKEKDTNKSVSD